MIVFPFSTPSQCYGAFTIEKVRGGGLRGEVVQIEFYRSKEEKALPSAKLRWERWQLNFQ